MGKVKKMWLLSNDSSYGILKNGRAYNITFLGEESAERKRYSL
jgi:hypothetical protein